MFNRWFFSFSVFELEKACTLFPLPAPGKTGVLGYNTLRLLGHSGTQNWPFCWWGFHIPFLCQAAPYPENVLGKCNWESEAHTGEGVSAKWGQHWGQPQRGQTRRLAWSALNTQPCWEWTGSLAGSSGITYWLFGFYRDILMSELHLCRCGCCLPLTLF